MNLLQKIILAAGAGMLVLVLAVFPVEYHVSRSSGAASRQTTGRLYAFSSTTPETRIDAGATALRGLAVAGATAAAWLLVAKKEEKE